MALTLTVLRCPPSVAPEVRQVTGGEFSIGRGTDNDWVLPDPARQLSKRHCMIAFRQGAWQVAGVSTNGTFVNRDETPLESRAPHTLMDGDRLTLGAYEIEVRVVEDVQQAWSRSAPVLAPKPDPFSNPFDDDPFAPTPFPPAPAAAPGSGLPAFSPALPATFDPLLPDADDAFSSPTRDDHSSAISDAINLPAARSVLPDDWDDDLLAQAPSPPSPTPPRSGPVVDPPAEALAQAPIASPQADRAPLVQDPAFQAPAGRRPEARATNTGATNTGASDIGASNIGAPNTGAPNTGASNTGADLLAAFLRGAGLQTVDLPDPVQTMEQLGAAFRAMVSGIRHTLIARSEVKREFRIEATVIRRRGNNLLKFSADDDDALTGLLGVGRRTDMGPEETITDALRDIRLHELATMTAMQVAVRALVERLGPDRIRDPKDQAGGLAMFGARKARAWDAYEALHAEVLRGLSDDFDSLFGKRFAQAYEQAMQELLAKPANRDDRR